MSGQVLDLATENLGLWNIGYGGSWLEIGEVERHSCREGAENAQQNKEGMRAKPTVRVFRLHRIGKAPPNDLHKPCLRVLCIKLLEVLAHVALVHALHLIKKPLWPTHSRQMQSSASRENWGPVTYEEQ